MAARTGESLTQTIIVALRERLERQPRQPEPSAVAAELLEIGRRNARRPLLDARSADEILGYDEDGLPT